MSRLSHSAGIGAAILALAISTPTDSLLAQVPGDPGAQPVRVADDDGFDWGLLGLLGLAGLLGMKRRDDRDAGVRRP